MPINHGLEAAGSGKWRSVGLHYLAFCALYMFTNQVHWREPFFLPLSALDRMVPVVPWTVWVYHSQFAFLFTCFLLMKSPGTVRRTLKAMSIASCVAFTIFMIYPTTYPRPAELIGGISGIHGAGFRLLYGMDSPANCFPSLHVALAAIAALGVAEDRPTMGRGAVLWASFIMASTLTTKQHYAIDIPAGLVIAVLGRSLRNYGFQKLLVHRS